MPRPGRLALVLACSVLVLLSLAAPAQALRGTTEEPPSTEAPPSTEVPPTEAPPATEAPPSTDSTSTDNTVDEDDLSTILILIVLGGGLAVVAVMWSGRRSDAPASGASAVAPQRRELLSNVRWLHDDVAVQVMSSAPQVAAQRWASLRPQVELMAGTADRHTSGAGGGAWQRLSKAITDTAGALDYVVSVRNDPQSSPDTVAQAMSLVTENRDILMRSAEVAARTIH